MNDEKKCVYQELHGIVGGKSSPLISIVVPVYNAAQALEKCVCSLTSQSFENIEILLVNNGSTDCSLNVCAKLASKDSRIKVIDHFEKGVSAARNRGIRESVGDYVMFVDADDWIDSNVCEVFANSNSKYNYDLFCFSARYCKKNKSIESFLFAENVDILSPTQKEQLQIKVLSPQAPVLDYKVNTRYAGSVWGKFYKREIIQKSSLCFATETIISEDCLFNTLALDYFLRIGYTRDCFYYYEQHDNSAQNRFRENSEKYFQYVADQIKCWLKETNKNQCIVDAANCLFVHYLFGILKEDLFHRDNKISLNQRCSQLKILLSKNTTQELLQNINKEYFSFLERLLVYMMKKKFSFLLSSLLWLYCRKGS